MSVYWLKFNLHGVKLKNFNIIPTGNESKRPEIYSYMLACVREFKKLDSDFFKNVKKYNSKKTYELFRKKYEEAISYESIDFSLDWSKISIQTNCILN